MISHVLNSNFKENLLSIERVIRNKRRIDGKIGYWGQEESSKISDG